MKMGKGKINIREITIFAVLGAVMFCSKLLLEFAPNIHLLGMFTIAFTVVYRRKALFPIYTYVFLNGLLSGFNLWWVPYLYIWTVLWGAVMLLPRRMRKAVAVPVYMALCGVHGLSFGTLYAPAQALMFHLSFDKTLAWIAAGFPFDIVHGIGNFCAATLVIPVVMILRRVASVARLTAYREINVFH